MAIKSKVNVFHWTVKLINFFIMSASVFLILFTITKIDKIYPYVFNDEAVINTYANFNSVYRDIKAADTAKDASTKQTYQLNINRYLEKGYRYFILDNDKNVIKSDSLTPNFKNIYALEESPDVHIGYYIIDDLNDNIEENDTFYLISYTDKLIENLKYENSAEIEEGKNSFYIGIIAIIMLLISVIVACLLAGRKSVGGEIIIHFFNRIYNDIFIAIYAIAMFFIVSILVDFYEGFILPNSSVDIKNTILAAASVLISTLTLWFFSSLSKRVKLNQAFTYTLIYKAFCYVKKVLYYGKKIISYPVRLISKARTKTSLIITSIVLVIFDFFAILVVHSIYSTEALFIVSFILSVGNGFVLLAYSYKKLSGLDEINTAISEIRKGNLSYKLPPFKNKDLEQIADDLENISEGIDKAVKRATVSERMKTELITNVSHDLKTPLTSIISYIELLDDDESLSDEQRGYVAILRTKAHRLKNIISDLFELSKSSSGDIVLNFETISLNTLIEQTLADISDKIEKSGRIIKTTIPSSEILISADGKRLYRAIFNVIDNALKYSMENTRIYIKLFEENDMAIAEFLNIASYEMNFSEDEIVERFTRGDEARTSEGSGLGLSIAKTFTELCGGEFSVKIDGDMFKCIFKFNIKSN